MIIRFIILALVIAQQCYGATPLSAAATSGVLFNRTNKNVAPDGLSAVMNTVAITNAEIDVQLQANFARTSSISYFDTSKKLKSFAQVVPTVNDLASIATNAGFAIVTDPKRGGTFYWTNSVSTNAGTIFLGSVGSWVRYLKPGEPITPFMFGAVGDGVTDDTVAVKAAHDYLINGGVMLMPGRWKYNLTITNMPIVIDGDSAILDYRVPVPGGYHIPANTNSAVIQVGNDTGLVKGTKLKNIFFYGGTNRAEIALYLAGGAEDTHVEETSYLGFKYSIYGRAGTNYPSTLNYFDKFTIEGSQATNGRGIYLYMPDNQTSYTTGFFFSNGRINGQATNNHRIIELDGCSASLTDSYMDFTRGYGILMTNTGVGQIAPYLMVENVIFDAKGGTYATDAVLEVPSNFAWPAYIRGNSSWTGRMRRANGTYIDPPSMTLPYQSQASYLQILGEAAFGEDGTITNYNNSRRIYQSSTGFFWENMTGSSHFRSANNINIVATNGTIVVGGTAVGMQITDGSLLLDNLYGVSINSTVGIRTSTLFLSSADNVFVSTPTNAGSILLRGNHPTADVQILAGVTEKWRFKYDGSLLPSSTYDIGTHTARAGTGYFTGVGLPIASSLLRVNASSNIAAVNIGAGLSFDGTNLVATGGSGTITGGANLGSGIGVFAGVSGADLQFNSLLGANGITVSSNAGAAVISLTVTNSTQLTFAQPGFTLTTSTNAQFLIMDRAATLKSVRAHVLVPSSSGSVTFDLRRNGSSILSSPASIPAGSTNAAATLSATAISAGDVLTPICTAAGTDTEGAAFVITFTRP